MWCLSAAWTIIGMSKETETYQIRGLDSHGTPYWKENLQRGIHGPRGCWRRNKRHQGLICCGQRYGTKCQKQHNEKKKKWAIEKPKLDKARRLGGTDVIDTADEEFKETKKTRGESWKFRCQQQCLARSGKERTRKLVAILMLPRQNTHASLKPTNLRESDWTELYTKIMQTILRGKESIHWSTTIFYTSLILCLKQWTYQMRKQQWTNNGKNLGKYGHDNWLKSKTKMRWSLKQGMRAEKCILRHCWTSVISRTRSWSHNFRNTKVELYSEVTDIVEDDSGSYAVLTEQGSSASQMTAAKVMDIIYQDYQDAQDKQQTQYQLTPRAKWKMHRRYCTFQSQNVEIFGYVYQNTNGPVVPLERNLYGPSSGRTIVGKTIRESSLKIPVGE